MRRPSLYPLFITLVFILLLAGCEDEEPVVDEPKPEPIPDVFSRVKITTNLGYFIVQLNHTKAPRTVQNFLLYVKSGHYDGLIMHRAIRNFMIQGGRYDQDYKQVVTREPIVNEADNGLLNTFGTIAMAHGKDPHSATSEFFINLRQNDRLDFKEETKRGWGFAVFGEVVEGMHVPTRISRVKVGRAGPLHAKTPLKQVIIKSTDIIFESKVVRDLDYEYTVDPDSMDYELSDPVIPEPEENTQGKTDEGESMEQTTEVEPDAEEEPKVETYTLTDDELLEVPASSEEDMTLDPGEAF